MKLFAFGLNHQTAALEVRERMAFLPHVMSEPLRELVTHTEVSQAALLSTCNRTELYCLGKGVEADDLVNWITEYKKINKADLAPHFYIHEDQAALRHLLRVAIGLDSLVLGEPQILGQLKKAYHLATEADTLGRELQSIFQFVFATSKRVRSETELGKHSLSISALAIDLAIEHLTTLADKKVLLIGSGETISLCARYLRQYPIRELLFTNRTLANAMPLAEEFSGRAFGMNDLPAALAESDVVITATSCPYAILSSSTVNMARQGNTQPLLLIDLAVPRDIEPDVANLPGVKLYSIDDLHSIADRHRSSRASAAEAAERLLDEHVEHFLRWERSRSAGQAIHSYRARSEQLRDQALQKALRALQIGRPAEEILTRLAHDLTNKILHEPTIKLRRAGYNGDTAALTSLRLLYATE